MKKYFLYILTALSFSYYGCDKPGPTELVNDSNSSDILEAEIISKEIDNEFYSNGYDTSGVTEDLRNYTSIVSVSGIKLTRDGKTDNISVAQVILSDKSRPVYSPNGKLIGYNTIVPGIIKFNSEQARLTNLRIKYREAGVLLDTVLGKKYELFNMNGRFFNDQFVYPYNSSIAFYFNPFIGQSTSFNIATPKEITGSVKLNKSSTQNQFNAELSWNGESTNNFSIIVGAVRKSNLQIFPLYRLKTADDGNLKIPFSFFKNIPRNTFDKISITFIRKYESLNQTLRSDLYISSQSIHTIIVDIP